MGLRTGHEGASQSEHTVRARRQLRADRQANVTRVALGAIALAGLLVVAGVALALTGATDTTKTDTPSSAGAAAADSKFAPDFTARLLDGGSFTLSQERGRPVLILFTASWCASCIPEVNKLAQLHEDFGSRGLRLLVLSIDPGDSPSDFDGLRRRTRGGRLIWGLDSDQRALRAYEIRATDTKVLNDPLGRIAFTSIGSTEYETLRREVARVLP